MTLIFNMTFDFLAFTRSRTLNANKCVKEKNLGFLLFPTFENQNQVKHQT